MKKLLAVLLALLMFVACMPLSSMALGEIDNGFASGSGTESDPYVIMTFEQLCSFRDKVNSGDTFEGKYITLGADIYTDEYNAGTISSETNNWCAIGGIKIKVNNCVYTNLAGLTTDMVWENPELYNNVEVQEPVYFSGSFDGRGYTVYGITNNYPLESRSDGYWDDTVYPAEWIPTSQSINYDTALRNLGNSRATGFFGYVKNGVIKNFSVDCYVNMELCTSVENSIIDNVCFTSVSKYKAYANGPVVKTAADNSIIKNIADKKATCIAANIKDSEVFDCTALSTVCTLAENVNISRSSGVSIIETVNGTININECSAINCMITYPGDSLKAVNIKDCSVDYAGGNYEAYQGRIKCKGVVFGYVYDNEDYINIIKACDITVKNLVNLGIISDPLYTEYDATGSLIRKFDGDPSKVENCYYYHKFKSYEHFDGTDGTKGVTLLAKEDIDKYDSYRGFDFINTWRIQNGKLSLRCFADDTTLYGDINSDGIANAKDALDMKKSIANNLNSSTSETDLNLDGTFNAKDVLELKKIIASEGSYVPPAAVEKAVTNSEFAKGFDSGKGTENDPFVIKTFNQLTFFRDMVNKGYTFKGLHISLEADIHLDFYTNKGQYTFKHYNLSFDPFDVPEAGLLGHDTWVLKGTNTPYFGNWNEPIGQAKLGTWLPCPVDSYCFGCYTGVENYYFCGNFNGNGHTIYGITSTMPVNQYKYNIKSSSVEESHEFKRRDYYVNGFFGFVKDATIENLNLYDFSFYGYLSTGFVYSAEGNTVISNCSVTGDKNGNDCPITVRAESSVNVVDCTHNYLDELPK